MMHAVSFLNRSMILALLWIVLTGSATDALPYGAVAVVVAAALSLRLYPADRPGVGAWRVAVFLPRFLVQSVLGGLDVARRAFDPRLPAELRLFVTRIDRDDEMVESLEAEVVAFLAEIDARLSDLSRERIYQIRDGRR